MDKMSVRQICISSIIKSNNNISSCFYEYYTTLRVYPHIESIHTTIKKLFTVKKFN